MRPHATAGGGFGAVHARFAYSDVGDIDFEALARADYGAQERERGRRSFVLRTLDEQRSLAAFSRLLSELCETSAPIDVIGAMTRVVRDEARHVELCGRMVDALGGWPNDAPQPGWVRIDTRLPIRQRIQRAVIGSLCIGESISVAMIAGVRSHAADPTAHAVLTQMLADESVHSRFGWWWLALEQDRITDTERAAIEAWLPEVFDGLERSVRPSASALQSLHTFRHGPFGTFSPSERDAAFTRCLQETVLPGLERAGFSARAARANALTKRLEGLNATSV